MPPRLAFYMLARTDDEVHSMSRTPWDEMCSIFLCLIYAILDERRDPDAPPPDRQTSGGNLTFRMTQLLYCLNQYCTPRLRPLYQKNPALISSIQNALDVLFPNQVWAEPPPDAGSLEWWKKMRDILDSFVG